MDPNSHIKVLMDSFMESGKVIMYVVHKERSGSYLMKVRIECNENGGLSEDVGEGTLNNSLYLRKKNKNQIDRDYNRSSKNHQSNNISKPKKGYNLRSAPKMSIENSRYTQISDECDTQLLSPEVPSPTDNPDSASVLISPDPKLSHVTESTPEPLMHASLDKASDTQLTIEPENSNTEPICSMDPSFDPVELKSDGNSISAVDCHSDCKELKPDSDPSTSTAMSPKITRAEMVDILISGFVSAGLVSSAKNREPPDKPT